MPATAVSDNREYPISLARFDRYVRGTVLRTANLGPDHRSNITLGLYGEAGEICDDAKKYLFHGTLTAKQTRERFILEAGDYLFYYVWQAWSVAVLIAERYEAGVAPIEIAYRELYSPNVGSATQLAAICSGLASNATAHTGYVRLLQLMDYWKVDFETVLAANEAKLAARHPDGWQGGKQEA